MTDSVSSTRNTSSATWTRWLYPALAATGILTGIFIIASGLYLLIAQPGHCGPMNGDCCASMKADMEKMMNDMKKNGMSNMPMPSMTNMPSTPSMPMPMPSPGR